jgi:predicted TIM-barrel fold metal-dependent hydrolase
MANVDCDSHILPEDAFDEIPAEYRREGPRIETDSQGNSCVVYPARQRNIPDYARFIPNPFNPRPRSSGNRPEIRIADMEKANIDIQVLVPSNGAFYYDVEPQLAVSVCRSYNNAVGRIVKKYPDKFIGLATVPLQEPTLAVEELDRAVRELGVQGQFAIPRSKTRILTRKSSGRFMQRPRS